MTSPQFGRRAALLLLLACAGTPTFAQDASLIVGTVTYRERIALPPSAMLEVRLEDVTRAGGTPPTVAGRRFDRLGQVPIRFNIDVDPAVIKPDRRYAVRAIIRDGSDVLFTSMETTLVLTQGHGNRVDLVLTRVGTPRPPAPAEAPEP